MATPGLDHLERLADAVGRFTEVVTESDLHTPVTSCPGWTTYDVVVHLANVHAWAATIVETGRPTPQQNDGPRTRRPRVAAEWYAGKAEDLLAVLRDVDPERPCWNLVSDRGVSGFWRRRQLHETTIHTLDLDRAAGRSVRVSPLLAEDGVDEVLKVCLRCMHQQGYPAALTAPLVVAASDTACAWTLTPQPDGPPLISVGAPPARPGDSITGPAEVLYRALWKRGRADELTWLGDPSRVEAFLACRLVP